MLTLPTGAIHNIIWQKGKMLSYYANGLSFKGVKYFGISTIISDKYGNYVEKCHYCSCLN